jgi:hypothetical protein
MKTLNELYTNTPISVVVDFHIQNDPRVQQLESKIHAGELNAIHELENRVAEIVNNEIQNFPDKEHFESGYLKRIKMLVRTKQILAS